jgi:thioredoxin 1
MAHLLNEVKIRPICEAGWDLSVQREKSMVGAGVSEVNDSSFDREVLQSEQPVLVDFWAAWCGPCKALAPIVDEVAKDFSGQLKVMKMDVDRNSATPARFNIRGIPALLLFKDGKLADQIVGYVPKDQITKSVSKLMAASSAAQ